MYLQMQRPTELLSQVQYACAHKKMSTDEVLRQAMRQRENAKNNSTEQVMYDRFIQERYKFCDGESNQAYAYNSYRIHNPLNNQPPPLVPDYRTRVTVPTGYWVPRTHTNTTCLRPEDILGPPRPPPPPIEMYREDISPNLVRASISYPPLPPPLPTASVTPIYISPRSKPRVYTTGRRSGPYSP
jgi:hypothetical protein